MPEILHSLQIGAPPDRVWEAVSLPTQISHWWTEDARGTARDGAILEFGFDGGGTIVRMRIDRLNPDGRELAWHCIGGHGEWEGTDVVFRVSPDGEDESASILDFAHQHWQTTQGILPRCSYDWAGYLGRLKAYVEGEVAAEASAAEG